MTSTAHSDFERLLPHRPPMLMLSAILAQNKDGVHCTSVINAYNPLLRNGLFPATGGVELLAQAAGTLIGTCVQDKVTRPGAIVQVKSFRVVQVDIPVGAKLHIHARYQAGTTEVALFEGEVSFGEQCFFTGTLMIALLPEDYE